MELRPLRWGVWLEEWKALPAPVPGSPGPRDDGQSPAPRSRERRDSEGQLGDLLKGMQLLVTPGKPGSPAQEGSAHKSTGSSPES